MNMYTTEIPVVTSSGELIYFSGVLIKAKNITEAEINAKKMNKDLEVIGEYISQVEFINELDF